VKTLNNKKNNQQHIKKNPKVKVKESQRSQPSSQIKIDKTQ